MAKLTRETQQIFANSAGSRQITAFGTAKSDNPTFTKELSEIQNTNYLYGWEQAILPDKAPFEEDMNALFYAVTRQLAYLFQIGMPEWDAGTEYRTNSYCQLGGIWYQSLTDENIGHNPTVETTYWKKFNDTSLASYEIGAWQFVADDELLPNETWLEGDKLLKSSCPVLVRKWGDRYAPPGATDTDTYLYLPDVRNRTIYGANGVGDFGYVDPELPNIRGTFSGVGQYYASAPNTLTGAFYRVNTTNKPKEGAKVENSNGEKDDYFGFDASLYSSIYKDGGTVKAAGIKVRVKTRYY